MSVLADKDVDSTMAADWAAIQEKYAPEEPEAETPEVNAEANKETKEETIPVSREADGKFKVVEKEKPDAKLKESATDKQKPVTELESSKDTKPEGEESSPQARDINRAPSTWKPAARAEFDKLSPAIKAEIHRRESDFQNGQAQLIPDATLGKELRPIIEPYRGMIEAEGGTPALAVADLFRTAAIMRTGSQQQKLQAIAQVCDQFHVDLTPLFNAIQQQKGAQAPAGQPPQQFRDPRLDRLLADQAAEKLQAQQREQSERETVVTRWMNEVDAQGNPKREYLNDVINEVSALIPAIRQADPTLTHAQALDAAYDRAIWAHPEIRTLLAQKQQTELDATRRAENQTRVRDAKRAGSVNVPRRASVPVAGKPGTMDQTLTATARELGLIT